MRPSRLLFASKIRRPLPPAAPESARFLCVDCDAKVQVTAERRCVTCGSGSVLPVPHVDLTTRPRLALAGRVSRGFAPLPRTEPVDDSGDAS